jgi:opacity protein-like surface antigen
MRNRKLILACLSVSLMGSTSFADFYTSINIGISNFRKPLNRNLMFVKNVASQKQSKAGAALSMRGGFQGFGGNQWWWKKQEDQNKQREEPTSEAEDISASMNTSEIPNNPGDAKKRKSTRSKDKVLEGENLESKSVEKVLKNPADAKSKETFSDIESVGSRPTGKNKVGRKSKKNQEKPDGEEKLVVQEKSDGEEKLIVQEKPDGEEKLIVQEKPDGEEKLVVQEKPEVQENPSGKTKPGSEKKSANNKKKSAEEKPEDEQKQPVSAEKTEGAKKTEGEQKQVAQENAAVNEQEPKQESNADTTSVTESRKMRLCGDVRIGYDHDLSESIKLGAFVGFGMGGGKETVITKEKKTGTKVQSGTLLIQSYIPVGLRIGYHASSNLRIFLSAGYARICLKSSSWQKEENKTSSEHIQSNAGFIGLGIETPIGNSKNVFLNAQVEIFRGKIKANKEKKIAQGKFTQSNFTVGVVYRF